MEEQKEYKRKREGVGEWEEEKVGSIRRGGGGGGDEKKKSTVYFCGHPFRRLEV